MNELLLIPTTGVTVMAATKANKVGLSKKATAVLINSREKYVRIMFVATKCRRGRLDDIPFSRLSEESQEIIQPFFDEMYND
jgi:hypothetical protein